jgi:hypothetical protein
MYINKCNLYTAVNRDNKCNIQNSKKEQVIVNNKQVDKACFPSN